MQLVLKNKELTSIIKLLNVTTAKGRDARAVARFRKIMMDKLNVYHEEEMAMFKEYCELNEDGEVIVSDGTVTFLDGKRDDCLQAQEELINEENIVDLTEFEPFIEFLMSALENSESNLNISEMDTLDNLLTKLEELRKEDEHVNSN